MPGKSKACFSFSSSSFFFSFLFSPSNCRHGLFICNCWTVWDVLRLKKLNVSCKNLIYYHYTLHYILLCWRFLWMSLCNQQSWVMLAFHLQNFINLLLKKEKKKGLTGQTFCLADESNVYINQMKSFDFTTLIMHCPWFDLGGSLGIIMLKTSYLKLLSPVFTDWLWGRLYWIDDDVP